MKNMMKNPIIHTLRRQIIWSNIPYRSMNGEDQLRLTLELVEFDKYITGCSSRGREK